MVSNILVTFLNSTHLIRLSTNKAHHFPEIWGRMLANYRIKITAAVCKDRQPSAVPIPHSLTEHGRNSKHRQKLNQ